jgi:hypothetical protein
LGHAGCGPRDPLGFLALGPRPHVPREDDLAILGDDADPARVNLGASRECSLDFGSDVRRTDPRLRMLVKRDGRLDVVIRGGGSPFTLAGPGLASLQLQ